MHSDDLKRMTDDYSVEFIKYVIRRVLMDIREEVTSGETTVPSFPDITSTIRNRAERIAGRNFRRIINATGVVIHTNLGRAPFSVDLISETGEVLQGYNNLEYDLKNGRRGSRHNHTTDILTYLTGGEDVMVVNNNAAALMLILRTFSKDKKTIVSRGELIEIGGSFRLPEIMAESDAIMAEVGTTNKTSITDYENAIDKDTALLLKAHKSNYTIEGFTDEASLDELVRLGNKYSVPVVYDMGSGLFRKSVIPILVDEPVVKETLDKGVDLVCFSGDKLLGGPQSGIIAGEKQMIGMLKKHPMARALRVGKLTLAFLETSCRYYLRNNTLKQKNLVMNMLHTTPDLLNTKAQKLNEIFQKNGIETVIVENKARSGGGSLPGKDIESYALRLEICGGSQQERSAKAEMIYRKLMQSDPAILCILKKGTLYFDVLTIQENESEVIADALKIILKEVDS